MEAVRNSYEKPHEKLLAFQVFIMYQLVVFQNSYYYYSILILYSLMLWDHEKPFDYYIWSHIYDVVMIMI